MKKVCHLIACLQEGHGPSKGILSQIAAQDKNAFGSSVWSLYAPPPDRDPQATVAQIGAGYRVFPMNEFFLDARILVALVSQLRQDRPDILHCHLVRANLYGRIAARLAGVPVVISTLRNVEVYMQEGDIASRILRQVEHGTTGWVSKYVAVSEGVRQKAIECLRIVPSEIVTILNGIDLAPFSHLLDERATVRAQLGLTPEDIVIGSVGRLHRQKNYSFLIRLIHDMEARFGRARLVIIGDGEERPMLEALIAEYGLFDKVVLLGFRLDIPRVLKAFDIFVLTSLYEGLPRSVMEAMAAGLPCVVSDVGGSAEAVQHGETGFVCPPEDVEGFASSLEQLLRNLELRLKMGRAGRERAYRLFSADRVAQQYADLYATLLRQAD